MTTYGRREVRPPEPGWEEYGPRVVYVIEWLAGSVTLPEFRLEDWVDDITPFVKLGLYRPKPQNLVADPLTNHWAWCGIRVWPAGFIPSGPL